MRKIGEVTDSKNLRMTRNAQVFVDNDAALAIGFAQLLRQWRRRIARCPDNRPRPDKFALKLNS